MSVRDSAARKPKLLVVDDQADIVYYVAETLRREGYEAVTASDGDEALEIIQKVSPDLIICDLMMPRKDGFEVYQAMKENVDLADIPFILLIARPPDGDRFRGYSCGVPYLIKPFRPDELLTLVEQMLNAR